MKGSVFWALMSAIYLSFAVALFFRPDAIFYLINFVPKVFQVYTPLPETYDRFTQTLAVTLVMLLSIFSFMMWIKPHEMIYPVLHFISKILTGAGYTYLFLSVEKHFAYLFGFMIEGVLGILILWNLIKRPFHKK